MTNHVKKLLISCIIREFQVKTALVYKSISIIDAKIQTCDTTTCQSGAKVTHSCSREKNGTGNLGSLTSYRTICELFNPKLNQSYKRAEKKINRKAFP